MPKTTVYFAAPLFTLAELEFNKRLADALTDRRPDLAVILPQERSAALFAQPNGVAAAFNDCVDCVRRCDVVLAVLDGADADSGTCVELGLAAAAGKPIVGIRTDFRALEDRGVNLMVSHVCTALILPNRWTLPALADRIIAELKTLGLTN